MYSDNEEKNGNNVSKPAVMKRKSRTGDFTDMEKRKLAALIKNAEHIWDSSNVLHGNVKATDKTWTEISTQMGKTKASCKLAWTALRESYRYYTKVARSSDDHLNSQNNMWEFVKDLEFLDSAKRLKRRYNSYEELECDDNTNHITDQDSLSARSLVNEFQLSPELCDTLQEDFDTSCNGDDVHQEVYTEQSKLKRCDNSEMNVLIRELGRLVNTQTEFMSSFYSQSLKTSENLTYKIQLTACDALLKQLPKNTAETTLVEIQNYILKKINDHKKSKANT